MDEIRVFESSQFGQIRTAGTSEEPLFCLADVCKALGLDSSQVMKRLNDGVVSIHPTKDNLGRERNANFVNEDGLYDVILDSRKPEAKKFRKWVTGEVLPSIRKHGAYATSVTIDNIINNPDYGIQLLKTLKEERRAKEEANQRAITAENEVLALNKEILSMQPKVSYCDLILQSKSTMTITQIAQDYGMSAKAFNILLRNFDIQHKVNGQWILYSKHLPQGYVSSRTVDIAHYDGHHSTKLITVWTQKGRLFLYDTLKSHGYLPTIEQ